MTPQHHTKIRRGVFETNSSSTHSISISSGAETLEKLYVGEDGICRIEPGEFGWEEDSFHDSSTKASYAMVWAQSYGSEEHREMLKKVIREATGAKVVEFCKADDEYYPDGYIDHQSDDVCTPAFESENSLKAFIFNSGSYLVTDNDNH
jgi:hypothetical protein